MSSPGAMQNRACVACYEKKLKCDRLLPCSNCASRSRECQQQASHATFRPHKRPREETDASTISSILARLDSLESQMRLNRHGISNVAPAPLSHTPHLAPTPVADRLQVLGTTDAQVSSQETLVSLEESLESSPGIADSIRMSNYLARDLHIRISKTVDHTRAEAAGIIQLPPREETIRLFSTYFEYIGPFQQIIFEPHWALLVHEVYYSVEHASSTTAPQGLALVLTIIAVGIILDPVQSSPEAILPTWKKRLAMSAGYIRATMDCLDQYRRRMSHTVESVQAMLVLSFLIHQIETLSPRSRFWLSEALTVSHTLGLHRLDARDAKKKQTQEDHDPIRKEIKRRVWWYLVSMDWMLPLLEGPSDSPYLIRPQSIETELPRHINNSDLYSTSPDQRRPLMEATSMSYVLCRLKVAEFARCIQDCIPRDKNSVTYDMVASLDSRFAIIITELPAFFQLQNADTNEVKCVDEEHTYIPMQRLMLNLIVNLIRCKLHQPYLAGHRDKNLHALSRKCSLEAASAVLSAHSDMTARGISHVSDFMKVQGNCFLAFMGALILAIDLCCNKPQGEERARQLADLEAVMERLDRTKQYSQCAADFVGHLTQLLTKYEVWLPSPQLPLAKQADARPDNGEVHTETGTEWHSTEAFPFDDLWDIFIERPVAGNIFGDL